MCDGPVGDGTCETDSGNGLGGEERILGVLADEEAMIENTRCIPS